VVVRLVGRGLFRRGGGLRWLGLLARQLQFAQEHGLHELFTDLVHGQFGLKADGEAARADLGGTLAVLHDILGFVGQHLRVLAHIDSDRVGPDVLHRAAVLKQDNRLIVLRTRRFVGERDGRGGADPRGRL
jgi:hypothetical protein